MIVCVNCREKMTCEKNGFGARWHESHYYPGDLYKCGQCSSMVIVTNSTPIESSTSPGISMTGGLDLWFKPQKKD